MKAFKGCINSGCKAYKKVHYKKNDNFCLKCGNPLSFVCAECWKPMENGDERYCISCAAEKEQHQAERKDAVKRVGGMAATAMGAVVAVPQVLKNADGLAKNVAKAADAVAKVVKK